MRPFSAWVAGSLLFALAGCSTANPSGATTRAAGATSGGDEVASHGTTDTGSRLYGAEPLGALVVETLPTLVAGPAAEPTVVAEPPVATPRGGRPVYRAPAFPSSRSSTPPPPPPPPHPAFPPPASPTPAGEADAPLR